MGSSHISQYQYNIATVYCPFLFDNLLNDKMQKGKIVANKLKGTAVSSDHGTPVMESKPIYSVLKFRFNVLVLYLSIFIYATLYLLSPKFQR